MDDTHVNFNSKILKVTLLYCWKITTIEYYNYYDLSNMNKKQRNYGNTHYIFFIFL